MSDSTNLSNKEKLSQLMDGEWHQLNSSECVASLCADEELRGSWMRYHLIRDAIRKEPIATDQALASRICAAISEEPSYSNVRPFSGAGKQQEDQPRPELQSVTREELAGAADEPAVSAPVESERVIETAADAAPGAGTGTGTAANDKSWIKTGMAGFGLAASVALATVVGLNLFQQQGPGGESTLALTDAAPAQQVLTASGNSQPVPVASDNNLFLQNESDSLPVVEFVSNTGLYWKSTESLSRVVDEQRLNMMLSQHIENSPTSNRGGLLPYSRLVGYEENNTDR